MINAVANKLAAVTKMNSTDAQVVVTATACVAVATALSIAVAAASGAVFKKLSN
jgi:hypothetical protein